MLRLDVSMEDAVFMHMVNGFQHLIHVEFNPLLRQIVPSSFNCFVHIHIHQLEYQC